MKKNLAALLVLIFALSTFGTAAMAETNDMVITVAVGAVDDGVGRSAMFFPVMRQFEQENPGVKFEVLDLAHDDYQTKIATLIAANDCPDLFQYKGGMLNDVVRNNLALPLNDILAADPEWEAEYWPGVFNDFTKNGVRYGFPVEFVFTCLLFYNQDIFNECGLDKPADNWDDFLKQCAVLREHGYIPIGMGNKDGWPFESCAFSQWANGFTGTDWFLDIKAKTGNAAFTDEEFIKALDFCMTLKDAGVFNEDLNSLDDSMANEMYYSKKSAMMMDGSWLLGEMLADAPRDVIDATHITFFPAVNGGKGNPLDVAGGAGWGYAINPKVLEQEGKLEMILKWVKEFNGSASAELSLKNGHFSGAMVPNLNLNDYDPLIGRYFEEVMDRYNEPVQCYSVHLNTNLINVFYNGLQDFWVGSMTAEEYAQDLQRELDRTVVD